MKTKQPTLTDLPTYHHIYGEARSPDLKIGMTLRQVLGAIRRADFGGLGGMNCADLSDGTHLEVINEPAGDAGCFLGSHIVQRRRGADLVATYTV